MTSPEGGASGSESDPSPTSIGAAEDLPAPTALIFDPAVSDSAKVLWIILHQVGTTGGSMTFEMTTDELTALTNASHPSVKKRLRELEATGWLEVHALRGLGRANIYSVKRPGTHSVVASD